MIKGPEELTRAIETEPRKTARALGFNDKYFTHHVSRWKNWPEKCRGYVSQNCVHRWIALKVHGDASLWKQFAAVRKGKSLPSLKPVYVEVDERGRLLGVYKYKSPGRIMWEVKR